MKNVLLFLILLSAGAAFAGSTFTCKTNVDDDGYYVKKIMKIEVKSEQSVFVQPYESMSEAWNTGGLGKLSSVKSDKTSVFKGFDSEKLFGDLAEGLANRGIYLYVSSAVMSGKNGRVSLVASGDFGGLEKGTYSCIKK